MKSVKGIIHTILGALLAMIVVLAAFFVIVTFTMKGNGAEIPRLFGYSMMTVQSGSMEPTISEGDVIIVKETELSELEEGDIITFHTVIDMKSVINTHRIVEVNREGDMLQFITKGDANEEADLSVVSSGNVIGKYCVRIPKVGLILDFLSTSMGFLIVIVLPLLLLFLYQAYNLINVIVEMKKQAVISAVEETSKETGVSELEAARAAARQAIEEANRQKEAAEQAMRAAQEAQAAIKAAQEAQAAAAAVIEQAKNQGIYTDRAPDATPENGESAKSGEDGENT